MSEKYRPSEEETQKNDLLSLDQAEQVFCKDFFGSKAIHDTFGVDIKDVPQIQFSREELERARELNQQLILYVDKASDGEPLTGKKILTLTNNKTSNNENLFRYYGTDDDCIDIYKESIFRQETPRKGWRLVSKEVVPGSFYEHKAYRVDNSSYDYLRQTEIMIDYLNNQVFKDQPIPKEYKIAIKEFENRKDGIKRRLVNGEIEVVEELENLQITKLIRETPIEVIYRLVLNERINKEKLLGSQYTWTSRSAFKRSRHRYEPVVIGDFNGGIDIETASPWGTYRDFGSTFSRSS